LFIRRASSSAARKRDTASMGAGASTEGVPPQAEMVPALKSKLEALKAESNKEFVEDTPRGVSAKEEVKRLRAMLKTTLEETVPLEKALEGLEKAKPAGGAEGADDSDGEDNRVSCEKCSRKFNPDRIEKHSNVCKGPSVPRSASSRASDMGSARSSASTTSDGVPKWKQDREKLKEQLKRDREAANAGEGEATDEPAAAAAPLEAAAEVAVGAS